MRNAHISMPCRAQRRTILACAGEGYTLIDAHMAGALNLQAHLPPCRYGPSADPFYYGEGVLSYTTAYFYNYDRKMIVRYTEGGVGNTWNVAILANGQNYTFVSDAGTFTCHLQLVGRHLPKVPMLFGCANPQPCFLLSCVHQSLIAAQHQDCLQARRHHSRRLPGHSPDVCGR